jgi:hypothetical protein
MDSKLSTTQGFGSTPEPSARVVPRPLFDRRRQRADPPRNISSENPASLSVGDEVLRIGRAVRTRQLAFGLVHVATEVHSSEQSVGTSLARAAPKDAQSPRLDIALGPRRASGQFFTNIAATCTGWLPNESERQHFWNSVAFYNYVQQFVGNSPRQHHQPELWERSHAAFSAVLRVLNPQLILVIGVTNWNNISNDGWAGESLSGAPESRYAETHWYPTGENGKALAFHVKHTSAGYNFRKFAPLYASAVELLKVNESDD